MIVGVYHFLCSPKRLDWFSMSMCKISPIDTVMDCYTHNHNIIHVLSAILVGAHLPVYVWASRAYDGLIVILLCTRGKGSACLNIHAVFIVSEV